MASGRKRKKGPLAHLSPERRGQRIKAALAVAKARGVLLGEQGRANAAAAFARAEELGSVLQVLSGRSLRAIAAELNARNIPAARGGRWYASTVRLVLQRLGNTI